MPEAAHPFFPCGLHQTRLQGHHADHGAWEASWIVAFGLAGATALPGGWGEPGALKGGEVLDRFFHNRVPRPCPLASSTTPNPGEGGL